MYQLYVLDSATKLFNLSSVLLVPEVKVILSSFPNKWYFLTFSSSHWKNPSPDTQTIFINKSWVVWKFKCNLLPLCKANICGELGFGVVKKSLDVEDNTSIIVFILDSTMNKRHLSLGIFSIYI